MAFHKAKALQAAEKSVAQGKIAHAIKQYQSILDIDPSDVSLLNTIGDLYIRERNVTEGLRQFQKLAEAYVREGFNVKAIAIYRKIFKVDPNSVDTLLKLAELYQLQGLSREAREQYLQAAEFFKKRNLAERALETLRTLVQLDPENISSRNRLAAEFEQQGMREESAKFYLESAEILIRRGDHSGAEAALKKAAEIDPKSLKIQILRARVAIALQQPEEAERIVNSIPELQADLAGKRVLLDAYLASRRLPQAQGLVSELFRDNPTDFAPVSRVSALLAEQGHIDEAYDLLASLADPATARNHGAALLQALRRIWNSAPNHLPTLELIYRLCERTANESDTPEVLEALGRVHERAGDLEKGEADYIRLVQREPQNEEYRGLLIDVQQKLGSVVKPSDFTVREIAPWEEEEPPVGPVGVDVEQDARVKEGIENSDLFARYSLPQKAISELEKVLQVYPDQIEVHRRILEISRKDYPERAAAAAAELARIFANLGDVETPRKYQATASTSGGFQGILLPTRPSSVTPEGPQPLSPFTPGPANPGLLLEFPVSMIAPEEPLATEPASLPSETSVDFRHPTVPPPPPAVPDELPTELDLTGELEALTAVASDVPAASSTAPGGATPVEPREQPIPAELAESKIEIEFYLEYGFVEEARHVLAEIEEKYPDNTFVAQLRSRFDERSPQSSAELPSGLLAAMEDSSAMPAASDDPETHYNLGIALRQMGLLDEAIGELQKVAEYARNGNFPPNFLPACCLLALSFMKKRCRRLP